MSACPACNRPLLTGAMSLAELRRRRGWSLRQAEEATGINYWTISRMERGIGSIHASAIRPLARAYGVTTNELLALAEGRENGHG